MRTNAGHMEQLQKAFDQVKSLSKRLSLTNQPRRQKCLSPETVAIVGEAITEAVCARFMEWNSGRKGIKAPFGLKAAIYEEVSQILTNGVEV